MSQQTELLQHYAGLVDLIFQEHNVDACVIGGSLSPARGGRVTVRARMLPNALAHDLAAVLGVERVTLYVDVEVRGSDG